MKDMLQQILLTLDGIEVKGKANIDKMFCVMCALEQLILEDSDENTENEEGEMNGR